MLPIEKIVVSLQEGCRLSDVRIDRINTRFDIVLICNSKELKLRSKLARDRDVITIDVLRNSTSVTCALAAGAKSVRLFSATEDGVAALCREGRAFRGKKLLAGEVEGVPIPGFHCSNSPADFTRRRCVGRTVFYSSTNHGAVVSQLSIEKAANQVLAGCFLNGAALARRIASGAISRRLLFVCAGFGAALSIEDMLCAGQILRTARSLGGVLGRMDDAAMAAEFLAGKYFSSLGVPLNSRQLTQDLCQLRSGRTLLAMGRRADVRISVDGLGLPDRIRQVAAETIPRLKPGAFPPQFQI